MIYDIFTYNGEKDMLKLHINMLAPYVDKFIICEANTTFSGNKKTLYFNRDKHLVEKYKSKIFYHVIDQNYSYEEREKARLSLNTQGAQHWQNEFLQKESIKKALLHIKDNDICYIGDVDEIWDPNYTLKMPEKLKLRVYAYSLDNKSSEQFWGTLVSSYKFIKYRCLNELRSDTTLYGKEPAGWHFTSMGGLQEVRRKLNDSYTPDSYNTADVQYLLPSRLRNGTDYLGRDFIFKIDESEWPMYLKRHRPQFSHLCKGTMPLYGSPSRPQDTQ